MRPSSFTSWEIAASSISDWVSSREDLQLPPTAVCPFEVPVSSQCEGTLSDILSLSHSVFDEYLKTTGKPIEASIRGELSGDFEKLMLAVGRSSWYIPRTFEGFWDTSPGMSHGKEKLYGS